MDELKSKPQEVNRERKILALLPWLKLQAPTNIRHVIFTPFSISNGDPASLFYEFKEDITRILSSYRDIRGETIGECALSYTDEKDPCDSSIDIHLTSNAAHLLAFAGLAKNKFCVQLGNYTNSSCFETVFQEFSKGAKFIRIMTRRRNGCHYLIGQKHGEVKFSMPPQCNIQPPVFDNSLLVSLAYVLEGSDPLARRLMQSIWLYNLACSDSYRISLEREIILMVSAFEQLFSRCQGANDLACKVSALLDSYGSVIVDNCSRINNIKLTNNKENIEKGWYLHRKWIQELHRLRSCYMHGDDTTRRKWGWSVLEHSLMAAFVFPLVVKILLAQESKYSISEADKVRIGAIDILLNTQDWFKPDPATGISIWKKTINDYKFRSSLERAVEKVIEKRYSQANEAPQE